MHIALFAAVVAMSAPSFATSLACPRGGAEASCVSEEMVQSDDLTANVGFMQMTLETHQTESSAPTPLAKMLRRWRLGRDRVQDRSRGNNKRTALFASEGDAAANKTVRREYEMQVPHSHLPQKSKIALVLIEAFGLGCLGVDRCYMGDCCLGTIKGVTLGGLTIWAVIDYFVILINCLESKTYVDTFGFQAAFKSGVDTAFWIALVALVLKCLSASNHCHRKQRRRPETEGGDVAIKTGFTKSSASSAS